MEALVQVYLQEIEVWPTAPYELIFGAIFFAKYVALVFYFSGIYNLLPLVFNLLDLKYTL